VINEGCKRARAARAAILLCHRSGRGKQAAKHPAALRAIVKRAGYSLACVSHARRDAHQISAATRAEIRWLLADAGWPSQEKIGFATLVDHPRHIALEPEHVGCAGIDLKIEAVGAAAFDFVARQLLANE
jgi:hypothetical protein